jgi:hypothetical protein
MKKLNKLQINSEKLMKNEELITLRGGYGNDCYCMCDGGGHIAGATGSLDCNSLCLDAGYSGGDCKY